MDCVYTCTHERTVIIAGVALGDPFYTLRNLRNEGRPPERESGHGVYDSVIANRGRMIGHHNDWQEHAEFIVSNFDQAYPSFVVQYRIS